MLEHSKKYDVALSFAGEQRDYVEATASVLRDAGVRVFFDDYEKVQLWGKNLVEHLDWVYREASSFCVMFVSEAYATKVWPTHERRSAQARAIEERSEYILPVRFDATEVPGMLPSVSYLQASDIAPQELASAIIEKLGPRSLEPSFPSNVDRLYKALDAKGRNAKERRNQRNIRSVGESFYSALERMTVGEREAVCGVLAFGCPAELPDGIHLSLDLLGRMIGQPLSEILDNLAAVQSLNVKARVRDPQSVHDGDELASDDRDLLLSFWSSSVPERSDATIIAFEMIHCATDHYCADHGLDIVVNLDFTNLSTYGPLRPITTPD